MNHKKLHKILVAHKKWMTGLPGGERADFTDYNFAYTKLADVDFTGAILAGVDFRGADLRGCILTDTILSDAIFEGAILTGTCIDPNNRPNGGNLEDIWEQESDGWLIGYRTRHQPYQHGPDYEDGKEYTAPVFSTCPETDCHPGLHIEPGPEINEDGERIKVRFRREDLHSAGGEHRVKRFIVIGTV